MKFKNDLYMGEFLNPIIFKGEKKRVFARESRQ